FAEDLTLGHLDGNLRQQLLEIAQEVDHSIPSTDLEVLEVLGSGRFSQARLAQYQEKQMVVVKSYLRPAVRNEGDPTDEEEVGVFKREVAMMRNLNHKNVVKILGYSLSPDWNVVMEYCAAGTVYDVLHKPANQHRLTSEFVWRLALGAAKGGTVIAKERSVRISLGE
ncbi:hypothetical protein CYMTET_35970, partial [Cymbomonas tetramitiformis]